MIWYSCQKRTDLYPWGLFHKTLGIYKSQIFNNGQILTVSFHKYWENLSNITYCFAGRQSTSTHTNKKNVLLHQDASPGDLQLTYLIMFSSSFPRSSPHSGEIMSRSLKSRGNVSVSGTIKNISNIFFSMICLFSASPIFDSILQQIKVKLQPSSQYLVLRFKLKTSSVEIMLIFPIN